MKSRTKIMTAVAVLAAAVGLYALRASSQEAPFMHRMGPGMMGMGMGPGMMGAMGHGSATTAEMNVIHDLIANHERIKRTVTNLPDGIRTVTESDDPRIAQLIKTHVASMGERVDAGNDPGLPIESQALHSIFGDKDKIRTTYETTPNGVIVAQTSNDPQTVAALQQHASEVSDLVKGGVAAIHLAMMRNGTMMHGRMMRGPVVP
jgi:hypothetical protein